MSLTAINPTDGSELGRFDELSPEQVSGAEVSESTIPPARPGPQWKRWRPNRTPQRSSSA